MNGLRLLTICLLIGTSAWAAKKKVPCERALRRNAKLVCLNPSLTAMDQRIKELKKTAKGNYHGQEHREWLRLREGWCMQEADADRITCLERAFQARIKQLTEPTFFPYVKLHYDYAPHLIVRDSRIVNELKKLLRAYYPKLLTHYERMGLQEKSDDGDDAFLFRGWTDSDATRGADVMLTAEGNMWVIIAEGISWDYFTTVAVLKGRPPATFTNAAYKWKEKYGEEIQFKMHY